MPRLSFILILSMLTTAAQATEIFTATPTYKACAKLATSDPKAALLKAETWLKSDNSIGPKHCQAMALYGLGRYTQAATALTHINEKLPPTDLVLRVYVTRQTVEAYTRAGKNDAALKTLTAQINTMNPGADEETVDARLSAELLVGRANILRKMGKKTDAIQDLDHALSLRPNNTEALLARADLFLSMGDKALAKEDLQAILRSNPKHPEAVKLMRQMKVNP
ncbi:MAG: tetratricopeptide repeat protein [Rickettsiales bacterium]|nr:tetratricopeptide repeat protein [Rickettsiales bacterium]